MPAGLVRFKLSAKEEAAGVGLVLASDLASLTLALCQIRDSLFNIYNVRVTKSLDDTRQAPSKLTRPVED